MPTKEELQKRVQELEEENDLLIETRPMPSDIPIIDTAFYDPSDDSLVILFECKRKPREKSLSKEVSLFLEPGTMQIAGVKVVGIRRVAPENLAADLRNRLTRYEQNLTNEISQEHEWVKRLRKFGINNREKRKLDFFINEVPKTMAELQATT